MSIRIDHVTGNILTNGGGNWVTPEMRDLAKDKHAWLLAENLLDWSTKPQGGKWFSKWTLNLTPSQMSIVQRGCELGIFKKDEHKEYWRWQPPTRPWILTALALRDEWQCSPEAEGIRRAIVPKNTETQTSSRLGCTPKQTD